MAFLPTTLIQGIPGNLPVGYCLTSPQQFLNDIFASSQWVFNSNVGNSFYNYGDTTPTPENRIFPWLRTIGGFANRWYVWNPAYGLWLSLHPDLPGQIKWVDDAIADIALYDEGNTNAPTAVNGPMWQLIPAAAARFPLAPGTLPSATVIALQDVGGEEKHTQTAAEVGQHTHDTDPSSQGTDPAGGPAGILANVPTGGNAVIASSAGNFSLPVHIAVNDDGGNPMPIMPPYYSMMPIKRTTRQFYSVIG